MPELPKPNPDFTQEQALTMILSSIALEEVALSHIINAEGEKIQYILNQTNCKQSTASLQDILAVNKSVTDLLEMVLQNQMILKNKMDKALAFLPPPSPPQPPVPPAPCAPGECGILNSPFSLEVIPQLYCTGEALQWKENCFLPVLADPCKIQIPCTGNFAVDLFLDIGDAVRFPGGIKFAICCENKDPSIKQFCLTRHKDNCVWHTRIFIELQCMPCYIFLCVPCTVQVRRGRIKFTKI